MNREDVNEDRVVFVTDATTREPQPRRRDGAPDLNFHDPSSSSPIAKVREGMTVVDASGEQIGDVDYVKMGDPQAATLPDTPADTGFVADLARAFGYDGEPDLPPALRERFLRHGFIKVDGGLFGDDRYVPADRIDIVSSDTVRLGVTKEELAEPA